MKPGTRVRLLVEALDLRQPVHVGDEGTIISSAGYDRAGWIWVHFDGQPEAMSMLSHEIEEVKP